MNQQLTLFVENIKCGGCANSISKKIMQFSNVYDVKVDKDTERITISYNNEIDADAIKQELAAMGYPEKGQNSFISQAKSMVSCVVGKL